MTTLTMKEWKKLFLVAMLAWLLLFLSLLSHFLDLRAAMMPSTHISARVPSLSRNEIRRLASIQAGKVVTTSFSSAGPPDLGLEGPQGELINRDTQKVVSWSSLHEGPGEGAVAVRNVSQGSKLPAWFPELDWEERRRQKKLWIRRRRARRWNADERAYDPEDFVSRSKAVVQRLWKGNVSTGMLSPQLQEALRGYLNSNKHHVAYRGLRRAQQSGREVLCELKRQARLRTLDGTEEPFASLGWDKLVPSQPLEQLQGSEFKTCAVVTSAGAILNSSLGEEIGECETSLCFLARKLPYYPYIYVGLWRNCGATERINCKDLVIPCR